MLNRLISPQRSEAPVSLTSEEEKAPTGEQSVGLCCQRCNRPIAAAADLLPEQISRLETASYPYQLDLLGVEDAWVYSATNPHQNRFDVARFGPATCARVVVMGAASDEHSFFPPYEWQMCYCAYCFAHLGWTFQYPAVEGGAEGEHVESGGDSENVDAPPQGTQATDFAGLVLTNLRERLCFASELSDATAKARRVRDSGGARRLGLPPEIAALFAALTQGGVLGDGDGGEEAEADEEDEEGEGEVEVHADEGSVHAEPEGDVEVEERPEEAGSR